MQVILLENIKKLGSIGQKVNVKDGYARNFLLKNKKALLANKKNEIEISKAKEILKVINNIQIECKKEAMENGQLYGSVTVKEIKSLIQQQKSIEIPADQIEIKGQIKAVGLFKVYINLHANVEAIINLNIQPISE